MYMFSLHLSIYLSIYRSIDLSISISISISMVYTYRNGKRFETQDFRISKAVHMDFVVSAKNRWVKILPTRITIPIKIDSYIGMGPNRAPQ